MSEEIDELDPRAARIRLNWAKDYLAHLEFSLRAARQLGQDTSPLEQQLVNAEILVQRLAGRANERITPRRRVKMQVRSEDSAPRQEYFLFLDECGNHSMRTENEDFPVFCLCGIAVSRERYGEFDRCWKTWKARWLGSQHVRVHEPDLRRWNRPFWRQDEAERVALETSLNEVLRSLPFVAIAAVIDKRRFNQEFPSGAVDDFLPTSGYLMAVDFVIERFVHFLYYGAADAYGLAVAESRGAREDAEVHAEYLRLLLDGTQWQSNSWFRYQLRPYMEFYRKGRNHSGLQVADLIARPVSEKILRPDSTPKRWDIVEEKLYDGTQGRKRSYGLKVFPAVANEEIDSNTSLKANEGA